MASSATTAAVRVLPNNKVYRQLFDAQVQLNDAYNKVRSNQLSKPVEIRTHPDATPLVKHIRDSGVSGALNLSQRKWMKSLPYESTVENPVLLKQQQFEEKLQSDAYVELENIKKEVFNLPDTIAAPASSQGNNVTERLAASRQLKFEQLWNEFFENIAQINQEVLPQLEETSRLCNSYYENGHLAIDDQFQSQIYQRDITSLDNDSFTNAYEQLDQLLPPRLESIQEYCQTIEELELERIRKIRELFKLYSDRLYNTYHLSDVETASLLEKQADELNSQVLENRRIYTELEARLLTGETDRVHRYRLQMQEYQNKWRDATWLIHKQEFNSKLKISQTKLESNLIEACRPVADEIDGKRRMLIEHINTLNKFVPPSTTRDNVQKWYQQGQTILNEIIDKKDTLLEKANDVVKYEILFLINEAQCVKKKVLEAQIYDQEQAVIIIARDIEPLIEDRKLFLEHFLTNKMQSVYNEFISHMQQVLNKLHKFIQTPAQLWDDHQLHLEHVTAQLQDMMRDARKPHDSQNEKKLTKLDSTLDEMRSASNETVLTRLLRSAYDQLDEIKASYGQFYELEHIIVNKYAGMIADEVQRYKNEIISCFKVRQLEENEQRGASSIYHTTSRTQTVYELPRLNFRIAQLDQPSSQTKSVSYENTSPSMENRTEESPYRSSLEDDNWDGVDGDRSSKQDEQQQTQTFLTEVKDQSSFMSWTQTPFIRSFQMKDNLAEIIMNTICRAFLEHNDEWKDETIKRADAVMFSKHDELDKEMDFQLHLHEPRRVRIEMDIHNVRAAELVMHDERVERHIRGVQETLEQTDADYRRMLNEFAKSIVHYKDDIFGLEQVFVDATTSGRLLSLQDRLQKQRDLFMENVRVSLRNFRKRFDDSMQYLRQANSKFRQSFKMFSDGGNFSREEIEIHRKKLEKVALQIDKAETAILKEMEKLEKKQLEEATKIMNQFQERFKNHMTDLQFIEITNRWISETQVKIKCEVATNNHQAARLKNMIYSHRDKIDSILNPNLDKQTSNSNEVFSLFRDIVLLTYERALYLKCMNSELMIPATLIQTLKHNGFLNEEELLNDLQREKIHEQSANTLTASTLSRRTSHVSGVSNDNENKSVKFAATPSHKSSPQNIQQQQDDQTISTIKMLLHTNEKQDTSDEIVDPSSYRQIAVSSSTSSTGTKASSKKSLSAAKKRKDESVQDQTQSEQTQPVNGVNKSIKNTQQQQQQQQQQRVLEEDGSKTIVHRERRIKTRDEIYALYCTFGEKKHVGQDFTSKILNILRDSLEGILSHSELYYRDKGSRPVTRPQAISERFEEYAQIMIEKLKNYEEQCCTHHNLSLREFRDLLELFEKTSANMPKIVLEQMLRDAVNQIQSKKQQFDQHLNENLTQFQQQKDKHFDKLRPTLGHPSRKNDLNELNNEEKQRQEKLEHFNKDLRTKTMDDLYNDAQAIFETLARNSEQLFILFDDLLTVDDVHRFKLPSPKQVLPELIRRQQAGLPLDDPEPGPLIERKQGIWPGISLNELIPIERVQTTAQKRDPSQKSSTKIKSSDTETLAEQQQQQQTHNSQQDQGDNTLKTSTTTEKKRVSISQGQVQRRGKEQTVSATVITQKTTLPHIQTQKERDKTYDRFKSEFSANLKNVENKCDESIKDLERHRKYWAQVLGTLQQLHC